MTILPAKLRPSAFASRILIYGFLILFVVLAFGPLSLILSSAFKTNLEIAELGPFALPTEFRWQNMVEAWNVANFSTYAKNSLIISSLTVIIVIITSVMGGYALSMLSLPGERLITIFFLLGLTIPYHGILLPIYSVLRNLELLNTLSGVVLVLSGLYMSFGVYLLRSFFIGLPSEISDAARIDGCNEWQVLWYIMMPMAKPAIASLAVFIFMWSWGELLVPLIFLQNDSLRTLSVGITFYQGRYTTDYALTAAGAMMHSIPVLIVYIIFQREFVKGVAAGSTAGM